MKLLKRMSLLFSLDSSKDEKINLLTDIPMYYDYPSEKEIKKAPLIAAQLIKYVVKEEDADLRDLAIGVLITYLS